MLETRFFLTAGLDMACLVLVVTAEELLQEAITGVASVFLTLLERGKTNTFCFIFMIEKKKRRLCLKFFFFTSYIKTRDLFNFLV